MAYVYANVDELEGKPKVGTKQCVALLQHYGVPNTSNWKQGKTVYGDMTLAKGTAIATFVNGIYQNYGTGNHAAYYISQDATGIWIMDQWSDDVKKPKISKRHIRRKGKLSTGGFIDPSNNADAFSVIE